MSPTERYNRWQRLAIAQLSVAVALPSALSVAGLGTGLSLLQSKAFVVALQCRGLFAASLAAFLACAFCSCCAVFTRTLDFRLTARLARKRRDAQYSRPLTILCLSAESCGRLTWFFFWAAFLLFVIAGLSLAVAVGSVYVPILFGARAA